jgi:DNA-binding CsgD family transcriptional regulator
MEKADPNLNLEDRLTERQREVVICMAKGMTNAQIARHLYMSRRSVEREIAAARTVFKVESREVLLLLAYHLGVVQDVHLKVHVERICGTCG